MLAESSKHVAIVANFEEILARNGLNSVEGAQSGPNLGKFWESGVHQFRRVGVFAKSAQSRGILEFDHAAGMQIVLGTS